MMLLLQRPGSRMSWNAAGLKSTDANAFAAASRRTRPRRERSGTGRKVSQDAVDHVANE